MEKRLFDIGLVLFFTRGMSIKAWDGVGILERELALYRRLRDHLGNTTFVTYGDSSDLGYRERLNGIQIVCNRWKLPQSLYLSLLCRFSGSLRRRRAVFKSNQVQGAEVALRAARLLGKKFVARCGYLLSEFAAMEHGLDSSEASEARDLERHVFSAADKVVVTTPAMHQTVTESYILPRDLVTVIPNYVDTDIFFPAIEVRNFSRRLCFIGRLERQKNPLALLDAIKGLDLELLIVGSGPLANQLKEKAVNIGIEVRFLGNLPHHQLPEILRSVDVFILPSHWEGHPKSLIEAMACGLPVIGTNVPGIRELIRHGENGYLCGTKSKEIKEAIQYVFSDVDQRIRMGRNAREFVVEHFSLDRIVAKELALLEELAI